MKYIRFILSVSLLFISTYTWACGGWTPYDVSNTNIYILNGFMDNMETKDFNEENIELWKSETLDYYPDSLVAEVVYKYSYDQIKTLYYVSINRAKDSINIDWANDYAEALVACYPGALKFLLLAKRCENTCRQLYNDPWYYPVKGDAVETALDNIITECRNAQSLTIRYFLQEVRALIALNRFDECIKRWEATKSQINNKIFYKEIELRVARAYLFAKIPDIDKAIEIYARYGDIESLATATNIASNNNGIDISYIYNLCPDAEYLKDEIQRRLNCMNGAYADADTTLLQLAKMAIKDRRAKDISMWYYVAAAVCDKAEQYDEALNYINNGEKLCATRRQKSMFKVARIFIDSKSMKYNSSYDRRLFNDLQWLDKEIKSNLTSQERAQIKENSYYTLLKIRPYGYYWADAMRRILIENVIPNAKEAGYKIRVVQLANYADYCLVEHLDIDKTEIFGGVNYEYEHNCHDYSNPMFELANGSMLAAELERYVKEVERPCDVFGLFLTKNGFHDLNYWNELLGTKFLREHNYTKAVEYLEKVPAEFQYHLNVYTQGDYMKRDPFEPDLWERGNYLNDDTDYKLRFAQEMLSLQQTFESQADINRRASAMIRYAIGMRNAVCYCWALTRYEDKTYCDDYPPELCDHQQIEPIEQSKKLITTAFTMFTCDEIAARHRYMLRDYKYVMDNYSYTDMAQYITRHCDTWRDYLKNKKQ